jgi:replicative DNA helicase
MGLQYEHKNVIFWASSTPTGRRGYYYKWCTEPKLGWTHFHYPAPLANPEWDDVMDAQARGDYINPDAYAREILAEFGTEEAGVFNKDKIDICFNEGLSLYNWSKKHMPHYGYATTPFRLGIRTIGVDWDKYGAPTNIIVLEILEDGRYMVVNRTQIPQSEFTLTNAIKRLIELNKIWSPQFIYIDRGFGEVQAEILTLYGKEHKESGLHKIVKPISFSSKINFINPATKQVEPKDAKHLMVNLFIFNPNDDVMHTQLMDYHIQSIGVSGRPIFTNKDDHTVDALMLAHLAIMQNFDNEFKNKNELYIKYKDNSFMNNVKSNDKYLNINDFMTDKVNKSHKGSLSFKRFGEPSFISRSLGGKKFAKRSFSR